jgi:hypothetical protein
MAIPRRLTKKQIERQNGVRTASGVLQFGGNNTNAVRYQHLPDYDPNETYDQIEAKLKERFAIMRMMTRKCISGKARSLVVSGPGGVGKTFDIDQVLSDWDPEEEKYTTSSGYVKATGLYKLLYQHREKGQIVKFDDSDSLFYDVTCLNFIKIATDTTERRRIAYRAEFDMFDENGEPIPRAFDFNGTMIFVSNLDFDMMIDKSAKLAPHLEAMVTRANYINMGMRTKYDYLVRLFMLVYPEDEDTPGLFDKLRLTPQQVDEVMNFIESNHRLLRECSFALRPRTMTRSAGIVRRSSPAAATVWHRLPRSKSPIWSTATSRLMSGPKQLNDSTPLHPTQPSAEP